MAAKCFDLEWLGCSDQEWHAKTEQSCTIQNSECVWYLGPQFVIQIPVVPGFFEAPQHQALDGLVQLVSKVSCRGDDRQDENDVGIGSVHEPAANGMNDRLQLKQEYFQTRFDKDCNGLLL